MSEQISYIFTCPVCGSNELLAKYTCDSVVTYPVTKLVEGDMRRDKTSRKEIWHGMEEFAGYMCAGCKCQFSSMRSMYDQNATIRFDV